jgi:hypothetical protein
MQEELRSLREKDPAFWKELTTPNPRYAEPEVGEIVAEDILPDLDDEEELDDTDVSLREVIAATHHEEGPAKRRGRVVNDERGGLTTVADAEQLDELPLAVDGGEEEGRGKRKKRPNRLYSLVDFARHWDNEGSDIE